MRISDWSSDVCSSDLPQTQAAVFARHVRFGQPLQQAITAPRWLLGRTWGSDSTNLKIESRFPDAVVAALCDAGHDVATRSEERRVGKEWVGTGRSRW